MNVLATLKTALKNPGVQKALMVLVGSVVLAVAPNHADAASRAIDILSSILFGAALIKRPGDVKGSA